MSCNCLKCNYNHHDSLPIVGVVNWYSCFICRTQMCLCGPCEKSCLSQCIKNKFTIKNVEFLNSIIIHIRDWTQFQGSWYCPKCQLQCKKYIESACCDLKITKCQVCGQRYRKSTTPYECPWCDIEIHVCSVCHPKYLIQITTQDDIFDVCTHCYSKHTKNII